jgi:pimeloyl-ACP methyl ester carboxylesterase
VANGFGRRAGFAPSWAAAALAALWLSACAPFVTVTRVSPEAVGRQLATSALTGDGLSTATRNVLLEHGLLEAFGENPAAALARLHQAMVAEDGEVEDLFALAELSFWQAQDTRDPLQYLAAAVYAYAFLFPEGHGTGPNPFDPRLRLAADLYNRALTLALANDEGTEVTPKTGRFPLAFGVIDLDMDAAVLRVGEYTLSRFAPVADLEVRGLAMRYRRAGLGAPLAASATPPERSGAGPDLLSPEVRVPVTLLLRISGARRALVEGGVIKGSLELYLAAEPESLMIAGERVPLEVEPTAALALALSQLNVLGREIAHFIGISAPGPTGETLASIAPYRPGLMPVVFVHGTFSSSVRWAEMVNRLEADPVIRRNYQFWFFAYDSSNPIAYSALQLRRIVTSAVARLDPEGKDPALSRMVLIGHSQGGLLVKMMVVDSGDAIWGKISPLPLDDVRLSASTREVLREALFVTPVPMVRRVIFISTPHRGSFVAARQMVAGLVRRIVRLPAGLATLATDMARYPEIFAARGYLFPTAIDNMSPRNRFLRALSEIPLAPGIHAHSIISVAGDGPGAEGNDGVVAYSSAHIEGVESELVVHSGHSTQSTPATIEEVRRILRLHLATP